MSVFKTIYIIILFFVGAFLSCNNEKPPFHYFFIELQNNSSKDVILQFKTEPLDSVVVNYGKYHEIFVDAASIVFQDSSQMILFENYCKTNGLSTTYKQDYYTIVAAFHKWLNNEKIDIKKLRQKMIEMSDRTHTK